MSQIMHSTLPKIYSLLGIAFNSMSHSIKTPPPCLFISLRKISQFLNISLLKTNVSSNHVSQIEIGKLVNIASSFYNSNILLFSL